ncbi:MAG TPA: LamG domain-containing protein, partial [Thermodesulfobacteriota bacterium]|nr:LamG domain-containing protein [Thermodesulfobacteriota bacterium]
MKKYWFPKYLLWLLCIIGASTIDYPAYGQSGLSLSFVPPTPPNHSPTATEIDIALEVNSEQDVSTFIDWDNTLVGWWNFEDGFKDSSTYGNDGTSPSALKQVAGPRGKAYQFDGIDDYIEVEGSEGQVNLGPSTTISMWVNLKKKPDTDGAPGGQEECHNLVAQWVKGGYLLRVLSDGQLISYPVKDDDGGDFYYTSTPTNYFLSWDSTYHIVYQIIEITSVRSKVAFYVNGKLAYVQNLDYHVGGVNADLLIGAWDKLPYRSTSGTIDEVMIFRRTLSESEIMALYKMGYGNLRVGFTDDLLRDHCFYAGSISQDGTVASTDPRALSDGIAPIITDIGFNVSSKGVSITWKTPDHPTYGAVEYSYGGQC